MKIWQEKTTKICFHPPRDDFFDFRGRTARGVQELIEKLDALLVVHRVHLLQPVPELVGDDQREDRLSADHSEVALVQYRR